MDTRTPEKRHEIMAAVQTKNTGPEIVVRKALCRLGYRFRLHSKKLPGRPDIVFPKRKKIIFVNGCFWHGHHCRKGHLPKTRLDYWRPKIAANKTRDKKNKAQLKCLKWDVLVVWQCQTKNLQSLDRKLNEFLEGRLLNSRDSSVKVALRPIAIDLFAGAGGLSLGFEQAGFDVVAAADIDPIHAAVHKFNFPNCAVIPKSVIGLSGNEIRQRANLGSRSIEVVVGGAPCQGFSLIGHRALDDPRNSLVREFVRIVGELDASYFLFENVKGLTVGRHRQFLEELIQAFEERGYQVRKPWRVLNASNYEVPQDRERLFLLGAKRGLQLPDYPSPTTSPLGKQSSFFDLPPGPSCEEVLADLPNAEDFVELLDSDSVLTNNWGTPNNYSRVLRCADREGWYFGYRRNWQPKLLTSSSRTFHTEISRRRFRETLQGSVEPISRFFKLPSDGISNTLRAGTDSARGAFTSPRPIHYTLPRCITVREMARLHGFPDWFRFHVTKWHGARQIGNAVAPPVARALAARFLEALGVIPSRPKDIVKLGDPSLLRMDMSQAARFWGISIPIARRDRKSGATKRKQEDIEARRLMLEREPEYV